MILEKNGRRGLVTLEIQSALRGSQFNLCTDVRQKAHAPLYRGVSRQTSFPVHISY